MTTKQQSGQSTNTSAKKGPDLQRFTPAKEYYCADGREMTTKQYMVGLDGVESIELGVVLGVPCLVVFGSGCNLFFGPFGAAREVVVREAAQPTEPEEAA